MNLEPSSGDAASAVLSREAIERRILVIRGRRVMIDRNLAELYGVETGALVRAMKRNSERFPEDFAFQLSAEEWDNLRCRIGISSEAHGGRRYPPYAFTQQGGWGGVRVAFYNSPTRYPINCGFNTLHTA